MGKIIILDENTSNKIAAGEVVERPSSVIKELVENSLDAGATAITIEIKNGGISYIKVMDNGSGMEEDDVGIAFERHATSKIRSADDIESITSMGFRGEALASIAAVSSVQLITRTKDKTHGTSIEIDGGNIINIKPSGCPVGTTIIVKNLFYNTPARFKFLKKDTTEAGYISEVISRIALGNPHVSFRFISNNSTVLHSPGNGDYLSTIFSIYGKDTAREVYELKYDDVKIKLSGYVGKPEIARSNRNHQTFFINRRLIRSKIISSAIDEAYSTFLMKNKYAFSVLNLEINPVLVDVNVHPSKMEVKFSNDQEIFRAVYNAVNSALLSSSEIRSAQMTSGFKKVFEFDGVKKNNITYDQQEIGFGSDYHSNDMALVKESGNKDPYSLHENSESKSSAVTNGQELKDSIPVKSDIELNDKHKNDQIELLDKQKNDQIELLEKQNNNPIELDREITRKVAQLTDTSSNNNAIPVADNLYTPDTSTRQSSEAHFKDARIIGQVFNTYIVLQLHDQLILMDQHAAHERIMFEEIKEHYNNHEMISQTLLSTFVLEFTHRELKFLEQEAEYFSSLGFDYEVFGSNSIILRSAPFADSTNIRENFVELLDYLMESGRTDRKTVTDEALYRIACKAAVKANTWLDDIEIKSLLEKLSKLDNPYTCPHGRPSAIKMSKYELEKMFKRIV